MFGHSTVASATTPDPSALLRECHRRGCTRRELALIDHLLSVAGRDWSEPLTPAQFAAGVQCTERQAIVDVHKLVRRGFLAWRDGDRYRVEVGR